jgi:hypothetical protein
MKASDVGELFYIASIANIPSILELGILSHAEVKRLGLAHESIASEAIQRQRDSTRVQGGEMLHKYANLFICARNSMMFVVTRSGAKPHSELAVLRVEPSVLYLPGVIVADGFAYSGWTKFGAAPGGLELVDFDEVHAERWTNHAVQKEVWRHKSRKSAEVLVPTKVEPGRIIGAYASCEASARRLRGMMGTLDVTVAPYTFFL